MVGVYYSDRKREKSAKRMARRVPAAADPEGGNCLIMGCSRPTQAAAGDGLSTTHCRYHMQRKLRHGSYWKGTYSAAHLEPYRKAANRYITSRPGDPGMEDALRSLCDLLNWGGQRIIVPDLTRRNPETKARAAIWRLNAAGISARDLLRDHLAITAAVRDEFASGEEYRVVQIGKAALRRASGYHKEWTSGATWHVYPNSSGLFLRVLGQKLENACGGWVAVHVDRLRGAMRMDRLASLDMTKPLE